MVGVGLFFNITLVLSAINTHRQAHCVPPLVWNPELAHVAQNWSENLAKTNAFYHSNSRYGETLAMVQGVNSDDQTNALITAIKMWYDEITKYNWSSPGFYPNTGHFTQVVWRDTTDVGFGVALNSRGRALITAEYFPSGNIESRQYFEANVKRPCNVSSPPPLPMPVCPSKAPPRPQKQNKQKAIPPKPPKSVMKRPSKNLPPKPI